MTNADTLQKFIFEHADIRGSLAHLQTSYQTIMSQHNYPAGIKKMLGECLVACALLSATIKFKGRLTLQFQGHKDIKLLIAQCDHEFHLRATAQFSPNFVESDTGFKGQLIVTIVQDKNVTPYQSIIELSHDKLSESLEAYFLQSEQISTAIHMAVDDSVATGMLIQHMPGQNTLDRDYYWSYAEQIMATVTPQELMQLGNTELLHRLFHETDIRVFSPEIVSFRCDCTHDKMYNAIKTLGKDDAMALISSKKIIDVRCEFCNKAFSFDSIDVEKLFSHE